MEKLSSRKFLLLSYFPPLTCSPFTTNSTFQILFYALRPGFIKYQAPTKWIGLNLLVQLTFNTLLVKYWGWNSLWYLIMSSFLAGSLHPCAGHFIAEHYRTSNFLF